MERERIVFYVPNWFKMRLQEIAEKKCIKVGELVRMLCIEGAKKHGLISSEEKKVAEEYGYSNIYKERIEMLKKIFK